MMITFSEQAHRYSGVDLSYETDRLPALAGVARNVAEVTGTPAAECLAGLWLRTLFHDLIFRREDAYESWDDMLSCLGSRDKVRSLVMVMGVARPPQECVGHERQRSGS